MASVRIEGVVLPSNKRVEYGLTYLHGIGLKSSRDILNSVNIDFDIRVRNLTDGQITDIQNKITSDYIVEGKLRKQRAMDIKRLQEIDSYRGNRHKKNLPVRGQNTKNNARTRRSKGRAIAKKKVAGKK